MKLAEALTIIATAPPRGFRVCFEVREGGILRTDYFPDRCEPSLEDEEDAWSLATKFAASTVGKVVNVYVVDEKWVPVKGYGPRVLNRYPEKKDES